MIIMKFGGSSIKNGRAIKRVAKIIGEHKHKKRVVVLSALGGVTDQLIEAHKRALAQDKAGWLGLLEEIYGRHHDLTHELIPEGALRDKTLNQLESYFNSLNNFLEVGSSLRVFNPDIYSSIVALGELLSTAIFSSYLISEEIFAVFHDARNIVAVEHTREETLPLFKVIGERAGGELLPSLEKGLVVVTQGFIARTADGAPTTLGRDGSDYSAAILGAALKAEEIQIWSDVNGILSADPGIIGDARPLKTMTFDEACELAYFGARVLHPATIQPAVSHGIPVRVLNSRAPHEAGTLITNGEGGSGQRAIRSIAYKENIALLTVESSRLLLSPRLIERVFEILTRHGKNVFAVSKAATRLSLTIQSHEDSLAFLDELKVFGKIQYERNKVVVSVVGEGMKGNPTVGWKIISLLDEAGVSLELFSQFRKQISMMFIIDEKDIEKTVRLIHDRFVANRGGARRGRVACSLPGAAREKTTAAPVITTARL